MEAYVSIVHDPVLIEFDGPRAEPDVAGNSLRSYLDFIVMHQMEKH